MTAVIDGMTGDGAKGALGRRLAANMVRMTRDRTAGICLENARRNVRYLNHGRSLGELRDRPFGDGDSAIVIAAGPSIKRNDPIAAI